MLELAQNSYKFKIFKSLHPNLPAGINGENFFSRPKARGMTNQKYLENIIDNTLNRLKYRSELVGTLADVTAAMSLLNAAKSTNIDQKVTVKWGLHQSEARPFGVGGTMEHFTMKYNCDTWHAFLNTRQGKEASPTIRYLSRTPANLVKIENL